MIIRHFNYNTNVDVYVDIPNNEIRYESVGNQLLQIEDTIADANIISHTYDKVGIIRFDNNITSISDYAFSSLNIKKIILPNSISSIGIRCFEGCSALEKIQLSNILSTLPKYVFNHCYSLKNITLPNTLISMHAFSFGFCISLSSITIPANVSYIGDRCLTSTKSLTSIIVDVNNPYYDSRNNCNAIIETATNTLIKGIKNGIIPQGVTAIGDYAFIDTFTTYITIPKSVMSIGNSVFNTDVKITYEGTINEWDSVIKDKHWCTARGTVSCIDGDITI